MGDEKKRRPQGRRAYLNDFVRTPDGEYVYTGKVYRWDCERKGTLLRLWGLSIGMIVCALAAGCLPGTGMEQTVWALMPYVAALIAACTCLYAVGRLGMAGEEVREYVFHGSVEALPRRCVITAVAAGAAILGEFVNLTVLGTASSIGCAILLLVLESLILAGAILLEKTIVHSRWKEK